MINQNRTWKLRWKMLALCAVLVLGAATLTDAQEKRPVAEIKAEIEKLQAELREATAATEEQIIKIYSLDGAPKTKALRYLSSLIGVRVVFDEESNSIVVAGSEVDHANVQELLTQSTREAVAAAEKMETQPQRLMPINKEQPIQERLTEMRTPVLANGAERYRKVVVLPPSSEHPTVEPPSDDRVIRELAKVRPVAEGVSRHVKAITKELLADYADPPRSFPLVGLAQLHHIHYKCTVNFEDVQQEGSPIPHQVNVEQGIEVLYIDLDRLRRVDPEIPLRSTSDSLEDETLRSLKNDLVHYQRLFEGGHITQAQVDAAQIKFEEAVKAGQRKMVSLFQQADAAYQQEKFDEAKPLLEDFVAKYPHVDNLQFVLYYLGAIAMRNDNAEEAEFYFEQATRMFPEGKKVLECKTGLVWAKEKIGKQAPAEGYVIKIFELRNALASTLAKQLVSLIPSQPSQLPALQIFAEHDTNRIIVKGTEGDLRVVEALVRRLDKKDALSHKSSVYPLKNVQAGGVAAVLRDYINNRLQLGLTDLIEGEIIVVADERTNSLIISTIPKHYDDVVNIIRELDKPHPQKSRP